MRGRAAGAVANEARDIAPFQQCGEQTLTRLIDCSLQVGIPPNKKSPPAANRIPRNRPGAWPGPGAAQLPGGADVKAALWMAIFSTGHRPWRLLRSSQPNVT